MVIQPFGPSCMFYLCVRDGLCVKSVRFTPDLLLSHREGKAPKLSDDLFIFATSQTLLNRFRVVEAVTFSFVLPPPLDNIVVC